MEILEIIEPSLKELIEDGDLPKNATNEDLIEKYELSGEIFIGKDVAWNEYDEYNGKCFYCGPAFDENGLSDCIYITKFLEIMSLSLGVDINVNVSENTHEINTRDIVEADKIYDRVKAYVSERYDIFEEHD